MNRLLRSLRRAAFFLPALLASAANLPLAAAVTDPADPASPIAIRFGFSRSMFREVNENDARASLKAYAGVIARERKLTAEPDPILYEGTAEIEASLRRQKVDVVAGPAAELLALPDALITGPFLFSVTAKTPGVEYLLLTRVDSGIAKPADLQGRRVAVLNSARGSLAHWWLDVLLGAGESGAPGASLAEIKLVAKPSLAVLPVFFRQFDACVVTRESFAVAGEMNPQVLLQLRIIATSPVLVPLITCFRRDFDATTRTRIVESLASLQTSVPGRQMLTIFQSEAVEARNESDLASTRHLIAQHALLPLAAPAPLPPAAREKP